MPAPPAGDAVAMRLDRFLWFARIVKTRSAAQAIAASGHLRLDGRPVSRASATVRIGSVIALPFGAGVRVLRIAQLPPRRGPAPEARACYDDLALPPQAVPTAANVSQQARQY